MSQPLPVSVIIPAYGVCPHLHEVLHAVLNGSAMPENIIVSHSGGGDPTAELNRDFPMVSVLHSDERLFAGAARNRGAALSKTQFIAFCDADTLPDSDWLKNMVESLCRADCVVVGSVGVTRSGGYWGMSTWIMEFSEQAPWRRAAEQTGGASCNMGVPACQFHEAGGFPEHLKRGQDTALLANLREYGLKQFFEPSAIVRHFNHSGFSAFRNHQLTMGKGFAEVRLQRPELKGAIVTTWPILALVLFIPKCFFVLRRTVASGPGPALKALALTPGILIGGLIWGWGCFTRAKSQRSDAGQATD